MQQQRGDRRRSGSMDLAAAQVKAGEVGMLRETRAQLACALVADARIRLGEVRGLRWQGRLDDGHGSGASKLRGSGASEWARAELAEKRGSKRGTKAKGSEKVSLQATTLTYPSQKYLTFGTSATPYKSACTARRPPRRRRRGSAALRARRSTSPCSHLVRVQVMTVKVGVRVGVGVRGGVQVGLVRVRGRGRVS